MVFSDIFMFYRHVSFKTLFDSGSFVTLWAMIFFKTFMSYRHVSFKTALELKLFVTFWALIWLASLVHFQDVPTKGEPPVELLLATIQTLVRGRGYFFRNFWKADPCASLVQEQWRLSNRTCRIQSQILHASSGCVLSNTFGQETVRNRTHIVWGLGVYLS